MNAAQQDSGYFSLAQIAALQKKLPLALEHVDKSLIRNYHNHKARHLKTTLLRKTKKYEAAEALAKESLNLDLFNFGLLLELYLIDKETNRPAEAQETLDLLKNRLRDYAHNYIEVSLDYAQAGFYPEAIQLLSFLATSANTDPFIFYYLGYYFKSQARRKRRKRFSRKRLPASREVVSLTA